MSAEKRVCIDANVFVYAADIRAGERHERAKKIIGRASRSNCVLPVQVLGEFFQVTTRRKLLAPEEARDLILDWVNTFPIAAHDTAALLDAMDAVMRHNLSFWDAMIWAVARKAGCSVLVTEDMQEGRNLGGVTFLNPFADDAEERLAALGLEVGKLK